jgi:hypothetical protein
VFNVEDAEGVVGVGDQQLVGSEGVEGQGGLKGQRSRKDKVTLQGENGVRLL